MTPRLRRLLLRTVLLLVLPGIALAIGLSIYLSGGRWIETENAYVKAPMVQVSPDVAGRAVEVNVRDHARVTAGSVLFRIDPVPYRLALAKAEAEIASARNAVETLRAAWREARTELGEAETRLAFLTRQAERHRSLEQRGVGTGVKRDEAEQDMAAARDRVATLRQRIQRELAALGGDPNLATDTHPRVVEAIAERDRAALDLERTAVLAPADAVAVNVKLQPGEYVRAAMPLFTLILVGQNWVEANLKETELTHVRVGQPARVVLDAYPQISWRATVESISPAAGAEFAVLPPQNASGNWVKVVQRLPVRLRIEPRTDGPVLRAGMTASIGIDTGRERSLAGLTGTVWARNPQPD